jgi:hypothetical protein
MIRMVHSWSRAPCYETLAQELRSLPAHELRALGIAPEEIDYLAFEATREHTRITKRNAVVTAEARPGNPVRVVNRAA